jgi:hypothetical protein
MIRIKYSFLEMKIDADSLSHHVSTQKNFQTFQRSPCENHFQKGENSACPRIRPCNQTLADGGRPCRAGRRMLHLFRSTRAAPPTPPISYPASARCNPHPHAHRRAGRSSTSLATRWSSGAGTGIQLPSRRLPGPAGSFFTMTKMT